MSGVPRAAAVTLRRPAGEFFLDHDVAQRGDELLLRVAVGDDLEAAFGVRREYALGLPQRILARQKITLVLAVDILLAQLRDRFLPVVALAQVSGQLEVGEPGDRLVGDGVGTRLLAFVDAEEVDLVRAR